jgi:deazaflavin-dependent oxidoreductase (nitroreductase family)
MSFEAQDGTRGTRQPGRVMALLNRFVAGRVRKSGQVMGMNTLLLTTIGRKTGTPRTTPVAWFDGGEGRWMVVASANGAPKNPAWYYNLAAHPDQVQIEIKGRKIPVVAEQLEGAEREAAWKQIITTTPRFATYEQKTDRAIPVIRLTGHSS